VSCTGGAGEGPRSSQARAAFVRFLVWLRATAPADVAQHYVQTFDLRRRCALYLTYYRYGDTRKRGLAMLAFKTARDPWAGPPRQSGTSIPATLHS
jgi:nitrate reductase molybdenum cofactor assembly chaperone NarJ/NarW